MRESSSKRPRVEASVLVQVAAKACVSSGTVSRVFNNSDLIPEATRTRVLSVARELGFRPRVGIRVPRIALITEPPNKTVMGGYVNTLSQYICYALSRSDAMVRMITEDRVDTLSNSWFDGIIGVAWETHTIELLKNLKNIPIIWFSDMFKDYFHCIYFDAHETGKLAGNYLLDHGHRKIAVIHDVDYSGVGRADGVGLAMAARGIAPQTHLVKLPNTMELSLAVKKVLDDGCTAVWVTGDDMKVLQVNWLLQELCCKRIPQDISLMGFENPGISQFQCPSLTTISCPLHDMAEKAAELVLQPNLKERQCIKLPISIIERASVATLPGKV